MAVFNISANDSNMGEYSGETAGQALDAYARDAGYTDYAEVIAQFGDDATAIKIDTDALCAAAGKHFNAAVFQDSYGSGVALIDGTSFFSYTELANAIGRRVWDFKA